MTSIEQFIHELRRLTPSERSLLRRSGGSLLSRDVQAFDLFTSIYWRLDRRGLDKRWLWLVMTLYPWNPLPDAQGCFGDAWSKARPVDAEARRRHDQRLDAILSSDPPTLDAMLLDAVRVLERRKVAIAWEQLTHDLHRWCDASAGVRRRWANRYLAVR